MVWMYCHNGKYVVKSRYHVARMLAEDTNGREESFEQRTDHQVWTQLWQLRVPSKIKIFGWRACLNILPSKVNLVRRQILTKDRCGLCQRCPESVIHAIWECSAAKDVWAGSTARIQKCGGEKDDFLQLFQFMMIKLSMEELKAFLVHCWLVWDCRNSLLHGGIMQHPGDAQSSLAAGSVSPVLMQNWKPPLGVGAVICDAAGDVMTTLSARGAATVDSEEAEALACQKAMEFAIDAGFLELIVERDNAMVMSAISSTSPNWSCLGLIYDDIGCLAAGLRYVAFSCIRRSANSVAHSLARYANVLDEEVVWLEDSPPLARDTLYFDSSFLNE
ncbi:uncharacterized protein LOC142612337 [Castanea sativa]|uniref:uncharacterized protein LOC142612337 n=1 Tax=Castanea sativa TaxID=21020 RepID=UPI003F64AD82